MMMNLFSIFDPVSSVGSLPLNWLSVILGLLFIPMWFWLFPSRYLTMFNSIEFMLMKELKTLLGKFNGHFSVVFMAMFLFLIFNNGLGLFPYIFTASTHLVFTLSMALPLWLGYFMYGWVHNTTHMLAHLVPQGTPGVLMPFMVLIESVSSLIRPGTLAVRLAANMIAGHLLLALMSGAISIFNPSSLIVISLSQIMLVVLESAVAAIQAYVFAILSTLYVSEIY
uniref:ATP synthase subunit a n=1 Tax=Glyptonotus cf. antarcticus FK-2009 TaxID=692432 RepID=E3SXA0_9CRUS|nr:ATP synthase F0 subunit 6 [Glyptonotus cf. antarcticus FK-2009]